MGPDLKNFREGRMINSTSMQSDESLGWSLYWEQWAYNAGGQGVGSGVPLTQPEGHSQEKNRKDLELNSKKTKRDQSDNERTSEEALLRTKA